MRPEERGEEHHGPRRRKSVPGKQRGEGKIHRKTMGRPWEYHGKAMGKSIGKSIGIEKIHGKPVAKLVFLVKPRKKFWIFILFGELFPFNAGNYTK
jgi:hypothetical protein